MRVYYSGDGAEFQAWFESIPGTPTVPPSVHWRLLCLTNDTVLSDYAEVSPEIISDETGITGVKATIDVDGALNVIQNDTNMRETKQLQVVSGLGTARQKTEVRDYYVRNLRRRT